MSYHININLNDRVKVRLTEIGLRELQRQHNEVYEFLPSIAAAKRPAFTPPKVDTDGYSTFQLWALMASLGHLCDMGFHAPFETNLVLQKGIT